MSKIFNWLFFCCIGLYTIPTNAQPAKADSVINLLRASNKKNSVDTALFLTALRTCGTAVLTDADIKRFRKALAQKRSAKGVPLRFRLSEEEVARFAVNRPQFPGVDVAAGLSRHYPLGAVGVHAIGYVGRISEDELDDLDSQGRQVIVLCYVNDWRGQSTGAV